LASCGVFVGVAAVLAYFAWPALLPPGRGPDLTHHLMLVDFLERNWRLPDASAVAVMVEMAHYTPGVHLLAALAGSWSGTDGFRTVYPVVAFTVALKSVLVLLIAARTLPSGQTRLPLALTAVMLCLLPTQYVLGSFVHDSFLAQVAAELFAVGMWWAVVVWDTRPSTLAAGLFAVMGVGAFLTWPMWVGPPIVTLVAVVLTHEETITRERGSHLAIALLPIALVAVTHATGRVGWLAIAGTTGIVLRPSMGVLGWPFVIAAAAGLLGALVRRRSRVSLLLALSIAVQAATLYLVAQTRGAAVPYMAFKMMYFIVYPLAVLGALALGSALERAPQWPRVRWVAWSAALLAATMAGGSLARFAMPTPIVSWDSYNAGRWARSHVESACVDYLVPNHETMHWLHLAVLGNSRSSLRTANPSTFDPKQAIVRWIEPSGLPYAIAHMPTLPRDVLDNVDVLEQFGDSAVITRRGSSSCADARMLAGDGFLTP
jgi:hypothetical protein